MTVVSIPVATARPYEVRVGPGALAGLADVLPAGTPAAVLTDATVARLHLARLGPVGTLPYLVLPPGEGSKSFLELERVLEFLARVGLDRRSTLIALGGGVVGDLGGLAAALFMRGIDCVQCPTTLLAQVDSSLGGKTAVNLRTGKNLAGIVHQPQAVLADTEVLTSLSAEELRSGLGEVVKSALVGDAELLALLEQEADRILTRDALVLAEVVARCVRVKAGVVGRDEHERGERKTLNLGHTFAHGIEHAAGFGAVPHGVAVAVGLVLALEAAARTGTLEETALTTRVPALLERLGLPASLAELRSRSGAQLSAQAILKGMRHDKKGSAARPAFVLPRRTGLLELDRELTPTLLGELLV